MFAEERRDNLTFAQVRDAINSNNPEQREAIVYTVYAGYVEQIRDLIGLFPQFMRESFQQLIADFATGMISRHFETRPGMAIPKSAGAKLLNRMINDFLADVETGKNE